MTPEQLKAVTIRHQVFLERLKTGKVRDVDKALDECQVRLISILKQLEKDTLSDLTRKEFEDLARQLYTAESKIMNKEVTKFDDELIDFAGYELEFEARAIENSIRNISLTLPKATKVFNSALRKPAYTNGDLLRPFLDGLSTAQTTATNRMLNRAYTEGWTVDEAVRALRGSKAQNYKDGITALKRRQAEAVVRTSLQSVSAEARFMTWAANSDVINGYEWIATLDSRTTQQCRSLDGEVFPLGKGPRPPIHVNCRSTTVPDFDDGLDFLDKGATRSSVNGPVDAGQSYYEWLQKQPKAFQNEALGAERAKLFRDGGLSVERFRALQLDKTFAPLTLEEMRNLEPVAFERAGL